MLGRGAPLPSDSATLTPDPARASMRGMTQSRWALVTGAGRGIGRAVALALAARNFSVALAARSRAELDAVAGECRAAGAPAAIAHVVDLSSPAAIDELAARLLAAHGGVDVLVNNAGVFVFGTALDGDPEAWGNLMAVNVLAPMRLVRRLAPAMVERGRGTIVSMGSVAAIESMRLTGAYAASKHALRGFTLSTYEQLREHGIKVVLVNPAFVDTPMVEAWPGMRADRMLRPEDVAAAVSLALDTSAACCPVEITLRLTRRADGT